MYAPNELDQDVGMVGGSSSNTSSFSCSGVSPSFGVVQSAIPTIIQASGVAEVTGG